jgi:hypothetical protein
VKEKSLARKMAWRSALSKNLQELRIHLSQQSPGSQVATVVLAVLTMIGNLMEVAACILHRLSLKKPMCDYLCC